MKETLVNLQVAMKANPALAAVIGPQIEAKKNRLKEIEEGSRQRKFDNPKAFSPKDKKTGTKANQIKTWRI